MVCSECAVALTRINVPFAIYYIAHVWHGDVRTRTYHDNAGYARNNTPLHTGHFHRIYLQIFRSNVGWNMYLKNKHTWRKHTINSACISFGFV
ncbi:hypothetical protein WN51_05072 [Melipona quadrifasciata]|uniref:Uncharacterized protein n=1 Tax=Melipona quadrifasciata TaxID=166423 RepID=A0A0M8ZTQ9_9HYME|nr:hypothetical protein WN51_05072 [Melipona quadrifasciata]